MALPKRHFNEEQAQARRQQVLDAARACFARSGFRGASMAEIARTASMSPGHIYNYFASKQEIVTGIVGEDMAWHKARLEEQLGKREDKLQALIDGVRLGVERAMNPGIAALNLEIHAEAARNPDIRARLDVLHRQMRDWFNDILRSALPRDQLSEADLEGRREAIHALFEGLNHCSVLDPNQDQAALVRAMEIALRALLLTPSEK